MANIHSTPHTTHTPTLISHTQINNILIEIQKNKRELFSKVQKPVKKPELKLGRWMMIDIQQQNNVNEIEKFWFNRMSLNDDGTDTKEKMENEK